MRQPPFATSRPSRRMLSPGEEPTLARSGTPAQSADRARESGPHDYQPISVSSGNVRSRGGVSDSVRSSVLNGSISWLGCSDTSQCETDEPDWNGLGA